MWLLDWKPARLYTVCGRQGRRLADPSRSPCSDVLSAVWIVRNKSHRDESFRKQWSLRIKKQKKSYTKHYTTIKKNHVLLYTNESSINQKIEVAAINVVHNITLKSFLKQAFQYTIYFAELKSINLTLIITLKLKKSNKSYNKFTIFIDN